MSKIKKIIASLLTISMFLPSIAYAGEIADSEVTGNEIEFAISYGADKAKNIFSEMFSGAGEEDDNDAEYKEEYVNPGAELNGKDIKDLYDLGFSMLDISNAIKLSEKCDKTPYEILKIKGSRTEIAQQQIALMAEDDKIESPSQEMTWQQVKEELNLSENIEVNENSEIMYDGEPDDIETVFNQLGLDDLLLKNGLSESEIVEAKESGVIENSDNLDADISEDWAEENNPPVILKSIPNNNKEISLTASTDNDDIITTYNGSIYPTAKYDNEKTSGYTIKTGYDINPVSGNLTVVENDLSLKGINGLDLNLNRVYSSERANMLDAGVALSDNYQNRKIGYFRVYAVADIKITYRESTTNGSTPSAATNSYSVTLLPPQQYGNYYIYSAVEHQYVDEQIERGNISGLFEHTSDVNQAKQDVGNGKYDKTISFSHGKIKEISILVDDNNITKEEVYVTIPEIPYYTTEKLINKTKSFSDLGVGWEFDFPYIEIKDEQRYVDSELEYEPYEYLHYGTKGTWCYERGASYSNLVGYKLKDMQLTYYGGKFDGRSTGYLLTESDGKKYYFGTNGELLGIEDRFGNKIRFYYGKNIHSYYVLNKIIDSVGREITFDYNRKETAQGWSQLAQEYVTYDRYFIDITIKEPKTNTIKTITYAKDKILNVGLTRTDIDGEEYIVDVTDGLYFQPNPCLYNLTLVTDSEGLSTKYTYSNTYGMISLTDKNIKMHGTEIPYSYMSSVVYPTGATYNFNQMSITDNFGTDGIREYPSYTSAILRNYYYNDETNKISNNTVGVENITHEISVKDKTSNARDIKTPSGYPHYRNITEIPYDVKFVVGIERRNINARSIDDKVLTTNSYIYQNDEILLSEATVEAIKKQTVNDITSYPAYDRTTTSYTYDKRNLCTKQQRKTFSDPESKSHTQFVETSVQRTYDDWGNVLTETINNDNDRKVTYTYDSSYHYPIKKSYKSESGKSIIENYTPSSNHKTITESTVLENNSTKKKSTYEYDSYGNVTKVNQYGVNGNMSQYATVSFAYADSNNVISNAYITSAKESDLKDANGNAVSAVQHSYVYDCWGNVIKETDSNGNIYSYEYDKNNRLTKTTNPDDSYRTYTYTVQFDRTNVIVKNQVAVRNENGKTIRYDYDSVGNLSSEYNVSDDKKITSHEYAFANGQDIVQTYSDVDNNSKAVTSFDALGRKTSSEVIDNSGKTLSKQTYEYEVLPTEKQFKVTTTVIGDTEAQNTKNIQYSDIYGNVVKEDVQYKENGVNKSAVTTYTYDYLGNVKTVREPRAADEGWSSTVYSAKYEYDAVGNVTKETDVNGYSITNTYDGLGNLITVKDKNGNVTTNTYDNLGRLIQEQIPFQKNGTSTVYSTNKYYYDGNGNLTKSQTANNAVGSSASYTTTEYTYNWQNQPTKVSTFDGSDVADCVQYYYDSVGNVLRMYTGDVDALKITELDKVSGSSNYAVTKYAYDSMNRCTSQTDALGQRVTNTYDINGNLIKTVDRNGYTLTYNYDGLNQLTKKSSSKSSDDTYTYTYNMKGNRTSMTGGGVTTTSTYDGLGRLLKESLTDGSVKEYNYDINGNRKSFKLTKGGTVQYTLTYDYDKTNQLTKVYENGTVKAAYTYNPDGTLKKSSYGSQTTDYSYNLASLLTEVNNANGSTQISKYSYTYYVDGNQESKTESVAGVSKGTTNYTYDGVNRLVKEQTPDNTYSYQYDIYGNRSQLSVTGNENYTTSYTYDKNNRLRNQTKKLNESSETTDFWYDPNGNQISSMTTTASSTGAPSMGVEPAGGATNSYSEYDSWNQLTRTMQNGKTTSYTYNGDGLRMSKTVDGVTTSHIWDGTNIAGDVTNGTVTKYIRGIQLISSKKGSNESFYTYNGHGDVVQLTNGSGSITKQYSYDAFGVETNKADNDTNPFRYCGEYYDTETNNVYLRARYYRPTTGRFLTEDSYWNVDNMIYENSDDKKPNINAIIQSSSLYIYCNSNPILMIDPDGKKYVVDSVARWIWQQGAERYLRNRKGWYLTATLLELSTYGSGQYFEAHNGEYAADLIKYDSGFRKQVNDYLWSNGTQYDYSYTIFAFTYAFDVSGGDLGAALHNVSVIVTAERNSDASWNTFIQVYDTFDFTEFRNPFLEDNLKSMFLWTMNDLAYLDQAMNVIEPVEVYIDFYDTY